MASQGTSINTRLVPYRDLGLLQTEWFSVFKCLLQWRRRPIPDDFGESKVDSHQHGHDPQRADGHCHRLSMFGMSWTIRSCNGNTIIKSTPLMSAAFNVKGVHQAIKFGLVCTHFCLAIRDHQESCLCSCLASAVPRQSLFQ